MITDVKLYDPSESELRTAAFAIANYVWSEAITGIVLRRIAETPTGRMALTHADVSWYEPDATGMTPVWVSKKVT